MKTLSASYILFFIFLSLLTFSGCFQDNDYLQIRIENISKSPYKSVLLNGVYFGDIAPGEKTQYIGFESAYEKVNVELTINSVNYFIQPRDNVGVKMLSRGKYTYQIYEIEMLTILPSPRIAYFLIKD